MPFFKPIHKIQYAFFYCALLLRSVTPLFITLNLKAYFNA